MRKYKNEVFLIIGLIYIVDTSIFESIGNRSKLVGFVLSTSSVLLLCTLIFVFNARIIEKMSVRGKFVEYILPIWLKMNNQDLQLQIDTYIENPRTDSYKWPVDVKISSDIKKIVINDMSAYILNDSGENTRKILYLHGGAYIEQIMDNHILMLDRLAKKIDIPIIIPIYPLAPEYTYEESYEKVLDLYRHVLESTPAKKIVLMGDSAGGGYSVAFSMYLNEIGLSQPGEMILLSPWLDVTMSNINITKKLISKDKMLVKSALINAGELWAGNQDPTDYKVSPLFGQMTYLPPVTTFVGTNESFLPDCRLFHEKLNKAGVENSLKEYSKMQHVFPAMPIIPEADRALTEIEDIIGK